MRVNTERYRTSWRKYEAGVRGSPVLLRIGEGPTQCMQPVEVHMFGYPDKVAVDLGMEPDWPMSQRCLVRCRKCDACMKHRSRLWTARAMDETRMSTRTWFGTLTLAPDRQTWARYAALKRLGERESLITEEAVFAMSVSLIGDEITKFLKRVRKAAPFRYLLVTEAHKSGLPHFHLLIHEYAGSITKRKLDASWRYGFSQFRLINVGDEARVGYVCKYLSKSVLTRVRASKDYGQAGAVRSLTERIEQATRCVSEASNGTNRLSNEGPPE